jgi:class 3 adenylate cyclase
MPAISKLPEIDAPLESERGCQQCQNHVRILDRYCSQCGARLRRLSFADGSGQLDARAPVSAPGERRQVTVMFCDLVGSTQLTSQKDPEETRRVMQLYQATCAHVVTRYGGHIAQTLGDGLLVYFGYPHAHEDDAERAVRAGLEITHTVADARGTLRRVWHACAVRIGISTGVVVVGAFSEWDTRAAMAVVGETPNIAARLQHLAGRNEVLLGPETARLVEGHFHLEDTGPAVIAGIADAMHVWRAREKRSPPSRFWARQPARPTEMVGRDSELARLRECWQRACDGQLQAAVIVGPAGVGKSRLAHALGSVAQRDHCFQLRLQCSSFFANTALYPVVVQLRRAATIRETDSAALKVEKLRRSLGSIEPLPVDAVALLARLLQLPEPPGVLDPTRGPERLLDDTVEVLIARALQLAAKRPVLALIEDAQWIDPTTLKLVQRLLRRSPHERLMLLITDRDRPLTRSYGAAEALTYIALEKLHREACHFIVRQLANNARVSDALAEQIVSRSDELPLYVEELAKVVLHSSHRDNVSGVPSSLSALLTERIDRVGPLKLIAQVGACIGRSFERAMLSRLLDVEAEQLNNGLNLLVSEGILTCDSEAGEGTFAFRHTLLHGAAYDSMLLSERRQVHGAIADILRRDMPEVCELEPETVARHLTASRDYHSASTFWLRAGELAQRRSAHVEAIAHLEAGLACIRELRALVNADEIDVQSALARSYMAAEGWPGARVGKAWERARDLARKLGDTHKECEVSWGLWANRATKGQMQEALEIINESLAQARGERSSLLMAHTAALMTRAWLGQFALAEQHAAYIREVYRASEDRELVQAFNHDPAAIAHTYQGHYYWMQGAPSRARRAAAAAIEHARQLEQPFHLCMILLNCSSAFWRNQASACALNDEALRLAASQRLPLFRFYGPLHAAFALIRRDPAPGTFRWLHECLNHVRKFAGERSVNLPLFMLNLARGHAHLLQWRDAAELLDGAESCIAESGERWMETNSRSRIVPTVDQRNHAASR